MPSSTAISGGGRFAGDPFGLWKPLADPRKPELPYCKGLTLSIHRHIPPPPFGVTGYLKGSERQQSPPQPIREVTQSEWCLQHPPADTSPHPDSTTHKLHVTDQLACDDGRGAQVIRCRLGEEDDQVYVAKIYDALYYSYADPGFGTAVDVTWLADQHYTREAAAYEDLQKAKVDGLLVPKYHGSWTFDMALKDSPHTRPVRMILMGYIPGVTMYSFEEKDEIRRVPPQQRLNILAKALEAESLLFFHGVKHGDFAPRNIMLAGDDIETQMPQVFLIDFNHSTAMGRPNYKYRHINVRSALPRNPMYRNWGPCPNEFLAWVPYPHRSRPTAFKGWLKSQWLGAKEFLPPEEEARRQFDYDEPVEVVPPLPDSEVPKPPQIPVINVQPRRGRKERKQIPPALFQRKFCSRLTDKPTSTTARV